MGMRVLDLVQDYPELETVVEGWGVVVAKWGGLTVDSIPEAEDAVGEILSRIAWRAADAAGPRG